MVVATHVVNVSGNACIDPSVHSLVLESHPSIGGTGCFSGPVSSLLWCFVLDRYIFLSSKIREINCFVNGIDALIESLFGLNVLDADGCVRAIVHYGRRPVSQRHALEIDGKYVTLCNVREVACNGYRGIVIAERDLRAVGHYLYAALEDDDVRRRIVLIGGVPNDFGIGKHDVCLGPGDEPVWVHRTRDELKPPAIDGNLEVVTELLINIHVVGVCISNAIFDLETKTVVERLRCELARDEAVRIERLPSLEVHDAEVRGTHDNDVVRGGRVDVRVVVVWVLLLVNCDLEGVDELRDPLSTGDEPFIR